MCSESFADTLLHLFHLAFKSGRACVTQETFHGQRAAAHRRGMKEPSGHIRPVSICHWDSGFGMGRGVGVGLGGCMVINTCSHGELLIERSVQRLCQRPALMISVIAHDSIRRHAFECSQACLRAPTLSSVDPAARLSSAQLKNKVKLYYSSSLVMCPLQCASFDSTSLKQRCIRARVCV